jgi:putative membrane protein
MLARFFGAEAQSRVTDTVRTAEARSLGQIVPVVVERSGDYPEVRYRGALVAAGLATIAVLALRLPITLAELPLVQIAGGIAGALLSMIDPLERLLAGGRDMDEAIRARALRAFAEHGLRETEKGTGVLVFASLFERRAVVLGDHGIHAKMGDGEWRKAVDALVAGMRRGDPASGFCEAITLCGEKLSQHFPRAPGEGPRNELSDELRTDPR